MRNDSYEKHTGIEGNNNKQSVVQNDLRNILSLDSSVTKRGKVIEHAFNGMYSSIVLIGSFAVGEFTKTDDGLYKSDIDFYIILGEGIKSKDVIETLRTVYGILNDEKELLLGEPTTSIWIIEYEKFYDKNPEDTLIPYQIKHTGTVLYGEVDKENINAKIEFNSHIGLCGVGYMQLLKGIENHDIINLVKAVFNQIGCFLITKGSYEISYNDRITTFLKHYPKYKDVEGHLNRLHKIKLSGNTTDFYSTYKSIDDFLLIFKDLFSLESLHTIFQLNLDGDLESFCMHITKDNDTHKHIRVAYMCYYFGKKDLAQKHLDIAISHIGYVGDTTISLGKINEIQQARVKSIGVFD